MVFLIICRILRMSETVLTKLQPTVKRPPTIPSETGYAISTVYSKNKHQQRQTKINYMKILINGKKHVKH